MSCRYAALIVLILAIPCRAADDAKPNTLTPKEISEGWILLFDGETTFGWVAAGKSEAREDVLIHGGDEKVVAGTTTEFLFYELGFEYRIEGPMKEGALVELLPSSQLIRQRTLTRIPCFL